MLNGKRKREVQDNVELLTPTSPADAENIVPPVSPSKPRLCSKYTILEKIGEGSYALVFKAVITDEKNNPNPRLYALKKQSSRFAGNLDECNLITSTILREILSLTMLRHSSNIVPFVEAFSEPNECNTFIVMDYISSDLDMMRKSIKAQRNTFGPVLVRHLMKQLLHAAESAHKRNIIHRDIKPSNILVDRDDDDHLYLTDWGMSRQVKGGRVALTSLVATLWYRAPELLLGVVDYGSAIDMWSIGCVMGELYTMREMFSGNSDVNQLLTIFSTMGTPTLAQWPEFASISQGVTFTTHPPADLMLLPGIDVNGADLLGRLLCYDPNMRVTATEALAHPFFKN